MQHVDAQLHAICRSYFPQCFYNSTLIPHFTSCVRVRARVYAGQARVRHEVWEKSFCWNKNSKAQNTHTAGDGWRFFTIIFSNIFTISHENSCRRPKLKFELETRAFCFHAIANADAHLVEQRRLKLPAGLTYTQPDELAHFEAASICLQTNEKSSQPTPRAGRRRWREKLH